MASEGKKIVLFDEATGMLTKEAMLAYVLRELPTHQRDELEDFIANDEMHRDIIEGMKNIPDKKEFDKVLQSINEKVANRTGAQEKEESQPFQMPAFVTDFRKIAAALVGVVLIAGIIVSLYYLQEPSSGIALNEKAAAPAQVEERSIQPPPQFETQLTEALTPDTACPPLVEMDEDAAIYSDTPQTAPPSAAPLIAEARQKKVEAEKKEVVAPPAAATTKSLLADEKKTEDLAAISGNQQAPAIMQDANEAGAAEPQPPVETAYRQSLANTSKANDDDLIAEEMPTFPGGEAALQEYLKNNMRYPEKAKETATAGNVYLSFMVGTTGRVKDIRVIKGVSKEINAEAIRLITEMPAWQPAMQAGKPVTMKKLLIIKFSPE